MSKNIVCDDVIAFIDKASNFRSRMLEERFSQEMFCNCLELGMQSPIEHMFWIAAYTLCESEYEPLNPDAEVFRDKDGNLEYKLQSGIYITPQHKVEKYRVDFLIQRIDRLTQELSPVVVELDGHDFHDKDKRQRSYEKARDRLLVRKGYRVLHFTGSDVVADPFKVAHEALELVGCFRGRPSEKYDKNDPLGCGE